MLTDSLILYYSLLSIAGFIVGVFGSFAVKAQNGHKKIFLIFGEPLDWQQLEGKRACRIRKQMTLGGYRDEQEKWPKIHEAMLDAMIRLEKALKPYIKAIKI